MTYDYIIVGAGSAGCVLAHRLTEDASVQVLLLEAGGPDTAQEIHIPAAFAKTFKTADDWDYTSVPQPHADGRALYLPRGKVLGGCSSVNAMIYIRGHRADYDGWAALGCTGWDYDSVLPYFKKAETNERGASVYHGASGPLHVQDLRTVHPLTRAFVRAGVQAGLPLNPDFNGARQEGVGVTQVTQQRGARCSTAAAYLAPVRDRANLTVITHAQATRVLLEGRQATGIVYRQGGAEHTAKARCEVLLAGGTYNSPQLLMLSGIGPATHLREHGLDVVHDLPGVGENLQDHLVYGVRYAVRGIRSLALADRFPYVVPNLARDLLFRRGPFTSNVGEGLAFLRTSPHEPAPDIQFHFGPVHFENHGLEPPSHHAFTIGVTLLTPESRGRVRLTSPDPLAKPAIDPNTLAASADMDRLVAGTAVAQRVARAEAFDPYRGEELTPGVPDSDEEALRASIRQSLEYLYHPAGTCAMGTDPNAVVDPELRVLGIEGLRVVDASVMPTVPRGNTNAPVIMIAERAADLVRQARHERQAEAVV